ncbi:MAG: SLC13 family permease [Pseudomonadota bacterium]
MSDSPDKQRNTLSRTGLLVGPLALVAIHILPAPQSMPETAWLALGLMLWMAIWWATEALPIAATALLPIVAVPALGLGDIGEATSPYAHPLIFLFMGGFVLGLAMQRWKLHLRIALLTLRTVGHSPRRQVVGFMLATAFLSMWVSNTATAIMMLPIALSVIQLNSDSDADQRGFAVALLLAIAYSANIGGIATLIGTPPNALLAAYLDNQFDREIGFARWMLVAGPVALTLLLVAALWLLRHSAHWATSGDGEAVLEQRLQAMGALSSAERRVAAVFVLTALAWVTRPLLNDALPWLSDTGIAIASALVLFCLPAGAGRGQRLMNWESMSQLPWGVLLLFGGGLSLAATINDAGLAEWIAGQVSELGNIPAILLAIIISTVIIFLTELTSNTATTATFLPLLGAIAVSQGLDPALLAVPAAIAASCAFMMPVATPPNAIAFSGGHLKMADMISAGFVLNIAGIVVISSLGYWLIAQFLIA